MLLTVIGKNSSLYQSIRSELMSIFIVKELSHTEINLVDEGSVCVVFSLAPSLEENIDLFSELKFRGVIKVINISTSAIYSLSRYLGSDYPELKRKIEKHLISIYGLPSTSIRVGIPEYKWSKVKLAGTLAVTSNNLFISTLTSAYKKDVPVLDCFELREFESSFATRIYKRLFNALSSRQRMLLLPFSFLLKFMGHVAYGYTLESSLFFSSNKERLLIAGNGLAALGAHLAHQERLRDKCLISIASSTKSDVSFLGSILEFGKFGNSNFWHGVLSKYLTDDKYERVRSYIFGKYYKQNELRDNWSFVPFRPMRPKNLISDTKNISIKRFVEIENKVYVFSDELVIPVDELIISLGVFGTISLLYSSGYIKDSVYTLSDHSVGYLGQIKFEKNIRRGNKDLVIKRNGYYRKNIKIKNEFSGVIRPASGRFRDLNYAIRYRSFYAEKSSRIVVNLLKKMNIALVIEAFYNKFGVQLLKTNRYNLFGHFVVDKALKLELKDGEISIIDRIKSLEVKSQDYMTELTEKFPKSEINVLNKIELSPGIHFVDFRQESGSRVEIKKGSNVHINSSIFFPSNGPEHISLDILVNSYFNHGGNARF